MYLFMPLLRKHFFFRFLIHNKQSFIFILAQGIEHNPGLNKFFVSIFVCSTAWCQSAAGIVKSVSRLLLDGVF